MSVVAGILTLLAFEAATSSPAAVSRASWLLGFPAKVVDWLVNPNTPGIPDLRNSASSTSTTKANGTSTKKVVLD